MSIFAIIKKSKGILGLNARNLEFIRPSNLKRSRQIADNKLLAKRVLQSAGLPVPKTYAVISSGAELERFDPGDLPKSFVLKPNRGFGGEGIVLTYNKKENGAWLDSDLKALPWSSIKSHIQDILDGRFSLANRPDIAFFEERIVRESMFKHLSYRGVPDIRIIVYNNVPVMAMMRLPTRGSHGRANLHLGGIGLGIDIGSGITTYAICRDKVLIRDHHFSGLNIPDWDKILALGIKAQQSSKLGYLGVDIVLAKRRGPIILELNARPGLSIQIANLAGLGQRLLRVKGLEVDSVEQGIRIARDLFGQTQINIGGKIKRITVSASKTESPVLKVIETVALYHKDDQNTKIPIKAKIDSGARSSSIDYELGKKIGYAKLVDFIKPFKLDSPMTEEQARDLIKKIKKDLRSHTEISKIKLVHSASGSTVRVTVPVCFRLKSRLIESDINLISREHLTYDMIIGRRDLEGFLIKPRRI